MNHYQRIGVTNTASIDEIKRAYKTKAKQLHPDMNKDRDTSEEFIKLQESYDILRDDVKRKSYDRTLMQNTYDTYDNHRTDYSYYRKRYSQPPKKEEPAKYDYTVTKSITLKKAIEGGQISLDINYKEICPVCENPDGTYNDFVKCPQCRGHGVVNFYGIPVTCAECLGSGYIKQKTNKKPRKKNEVCNLCCIRKQQSTKQQVTINIPSGLVDNDTLTAVFGKKRIKVIIKIKNTKTIQTSGKDILMSKKISLKKATDGGKVIVNTPTGKIRVSIPAGIQNGAKLLLKGKGINTRHGSGNVILTIVIS